MWSYSEKLINSKFKLDKNTIKVGSEVVKNGSFEY